MKDRNGKPVAHSATAAVNSVPAAPTQVLLAKSLDETQAPRPDPEVLERRTRRRYNARYKLQVLQQTDGLAEGQIGAYLRREGLYWSLLSKWRRQREEGTLTGLEPRRRGRKIAPAPSPESRRALEVEKENVRLKARLDQALFALEVQKKVLLLCEQVVSNATKSTTS